MRFFHTDDTHVDASSSRADTVGARPREAPPEQLHLAIRADGALVQGLRRIDLE